MTNSIKQYLQGFINIVYPHYCAACGNVLYNNESILCLRCLADLPRTRFHNDPENDVARIFWGRIPVAHATSFMFFTGNSRYRQVLHELKYHGQQQIGVEMGKMFGLELKNTPFDCVDAIIPVPLFPSKQKERGYNQSELIANGVASVLQKPVIPDAVQRIKATSTQTRKARYDRWENVKHTFKTNDSHKLKNKHVLIVDDVITTGATIEACAASLLVTGDITISIAALACVKLQ